MIYVVDTVSSDALFRKEWATLFPEYLRSEVGVPVKVVQPDDTFYFQNVFEGTFFYKMHQFTKFHKLINDGKIKPGDVIIFTDAWNLTAPALKYLIDIKEIPNVTLIGMWSNGVYDETSNLRYHTVIREKRWLNAYERALSYTYDYNCFLSTEHREKFMTRYNHKIQHVCVVTGYPLGHMLKPEYDVAAKTNSILLCEVISEPDQVDIFDSFKQYFVDWEFIFPVADRFRREDYVAALQRSKIIFSASHFESNPFYIYEGMRYGCIPLIPDRMVFKNAFPEKYHYPSHMTSPPFMNFVRGRNVMQGILENIMLNYETWHEGVLKDAEEVGKLYFMEHQLVNLIQSLKR